MKKWILLLMVFVLGMGYNFAHASDFLGTFGQYYDQADTVIMQLGTHDNTGLIVADVDTIVIVRYYRGVKMDSLLSHGTRGADHAQVTALGAAGSGRYEIRLRAAFATDSTGQYSVYVRVATGTDQGLKTFTYKVLRGSGENSLFDLQMMLAAGNNYYRAFFPANGTAPKDSVRLYGVWDTNDDGDFLDAADTVLVSTTHWQHNNVAHILDSSRTVYHYPVPAP